MSRLYVLSLTVAVCTLVSSTVATQSAKPLETKPWATSWEEFAKVLAPDLARSGSDAFDKFRREAVTWEGTVAKATDYENLRMGAIELEMSRQTFKIDTAQIAGTAEVTVIYVRPKDGSLDAWKKVPPGTRTAFRGVFGASSISNLGGRIQLGIMVNNAEPVSPSAH